MARWLNDVCEDALDPAKGPDAGEHECTSQAERDEIIEVERVALLQQRPAKALDDTDQRVEVIDFAEFLRDGLEAVEEGDVLLKLISPLRPGLIEAADASGFLYLIMPIRLNV